MAFHTKVEALTVGSEEVPEEMLEELKNEIARNVEATKLVKEREQEACLARNRAAESHRRMHEMMSKYDEMKKKLEWTRQTLAETSTRLEQHNSSRQAQIAESVTELKERADFFTSKLDERNAKRECLPAPPDEDDSDSLTDAERMLLQLCQQHRNVESESALPEDRPVNFSALAELSDQIKGNSTAEGGVLTAAVTQVESTLRDKSESHPGEHIKASDERRLSVQGGAMEGDHEERKRPEVDAQMVEVTMDLNATVSMMEAKCAGVREELGQMAMSEQYMRTKQAQLLAKRREKEAGEALLLAAKKEQEAKEMRQKVMDMMRLLEERKKKLRVTECVLEKKAVVVEKVNKLLESKERRGNLLEKQRDESLVFNKKPKKK